MLILIGLLTAAAYFVAYHGAPGAYGVRVALLLASGGAFIGGVL
jgi:hypothetical protein